MNNNEWSTTPPKKSGWYWVLTDHNKEPEYEGLQIVEVWQLLDTDKLYVSIMGTDAQTEFDEFTHWQGPITPPSEMV